jgi:cytochrome c
MKPANLRLCLVLLIAMFLSACSSRKEKHILVFTKTAGFYHESIPAGVSALQALGQKHHFIVDTTSNAELFNEEDLQRYTAVVFLNTTGDVLNREQQNDFERYIQAGGGYVGVHAAADTEYSWPWYGQLTGAYFNGHPNGPNVREAEFYTADKTHIASDSLPDRWKRTDEFYNYKDIQKDLHVLVLIDEKTYEGGINGDNHPMSWYHDFDGGRAFYTGMGHTNETYADPIFLRHLWGGLQYAMGDAKLDFTKAHTLRVPAENRFTKTVLDEKLDEPLELAVLPGQRVLFIERKGKLKLYDPAAGKTKVIAEIPVSTKYTARDGKQSEAEDGLLGITLDPNFETNHWLYLYYSPAGHESKNVLARYELKGDELVQDSKKVILEVVTQREQCCHTGGSMAFDKDGNLFLSTGDNTSPRATTYSPIDNRPGRSPWDASKSSGNTNDLRGKVLRIHPDADGTYTIPDGNLFKKGTEKTRPEIYAMGTRNPYRISVDKKTGYLYWGDVGPDAGTDSTGRGPRAFDEINQARKAGFFGWPFFVGDNKAYHERDFKTGKQGAAFNADSPVNRSPNNTGLENLPPAQKAFIWYPYDASPEFPLVGSGGRTAMAGEVFYSEDFKKAPRAFPDYYNGKLFIYEWMRGWIMAVTMDKEGNYISMEPFMPSHRFSNPVDMQFAPDGDLYMLEYGTAWFQGNEDARLVKIEYNGGNRKPQLHIAASKPKGAVPLEVNFSSAGTKDFDRDALTYAWTITDKDQKTVSTFNEPNPSFTFAQPGVYKATLTVTDAKGEKSSGDLTIEAGNEPPVLSFEITKGNQSFFLPGQSFDYQVKVADKEDGSLEAGTIAADQVAVTIDYLKEGFDQVQISQGHVEADALAGFARGNKLMGENDCKSCHMIDKKSIGPAYTDVAKKYRDDPKAQDYLVKKVIEGGSGVWGDVAMAAHPQLSKDDAGEIVKYILSLGSEHAAKRLPANGTFETKLDKQDPGQGVFVLRASYTDKGANGLPPATSSQTMILRSTSIPAGKASAISNIMRFKLPEPPMELMIYSANNSNTSFNHLDLTGIDQLVLVTVAPEEGLYAAGGMIEVHVDRPDGPLIGQTGPIAVQKGKFTTPQPQINPVKLVSTPGFHDVYLVGKNKDARTGQPLFILLNLQFLSSSPATKTVAHK